LVTPSYITSLSLSLTHTHEHTQLTSSQTVYASPVTIALLYLKKSYWFISFPLFALESLGWCKTVFPPSEKKVVKLKFCEKWASIYDNRTALMWLFVGTSEMRQVGKTVSPNHHHHHHHHKNSVYLCMTKCLNYKIVPSIQILRPYLKILR